MTKELLSEVLGEKIEEYSIDKNRIVYSLGWTFDSVFGSEQDIEEVNIYELAHKCKEWAYKQGYSISIMREVDGDKLWYYDIWGMDMLSKHESSLNKSELEAIFKACGWIREKKEKEL